MAVAHKNSSRNKLAVAAIVALMSLCTALRANVLGLVGVEPHVQLSVLVNRCSRKLPNGFQCSSN
jgi:hypothetical protein